MPLRVVASIPLEAVSAVDEWTSSSIGFVSNFKRTDVVLKCGSKLTR